MFHFRPRRFVRLAVDLLSLGVTSGTGSSNWELWSQDANASAVLHPPPSQPLHLARMPACQGLLYHVNARTRRLLRSRPISFRGRRYLASTALLLASSLQVCGCNPAGELLVDRDVAGYRVAREAVHTGPALSFYDPSETAGDSAEAPPPVSDILIDIRPDPPDAKPLPWAIPESVYFLYKGRRHDELRPHQPAVATAFVLSVPDRTHNRFLRFLVTARHVVDPHWAHCSEPNPASIDVRFNRRAGGVGYETVPLQTGASRRFITPSDATADLAIIPLDRSSIANLDDYKFLDIPFRLLPTDPEMLTVRDDQPVMTASLPSRSSPETGTYPVSDAGHISKMTTDDVGVQCGRAPDTQAQERPLHIWFINAGVPQGVSGAPVYTFIARNREAIKSPVLLGIQSVAWPDNGIAGITPSSVLSDLIQTTLRDSRLKMDFYKGPNP